MDTTRPTTEEDKRARNWRKLQNAETVEELRNVAYEYATEILGYEDIRETERPRLAIDPHHEKGTQYTLWDDTYPRNPVPLVYFETDENGEPFGGDHEYFERANE